MAQDDKSIKYIEQIDELFPSPDVRAKRIWEIISPILKREDATEWDTLCFAAEYLGWVSQSFPFIEPEIKVILRLLYKVHYGDRNSDGYKSNSAAERRDKTPLKIESRIRGSQSSNDLHVEGNELK